jgi:hypothetical protein
MSKSTALLALFALAGCSAPHAPGGTVAVSVAPLGLSGVVYDIHLYEQSAADARSFVEVATHLNQVPSAADGSFAASYPCRVLAPGAVGRVDVVAHLPSIDGAIADVVLKDFSEINPADLKNAVGEQLKFARKSRPFTCAAGQSAAVALPLEVSQRTDLAADWSSMQVPYNGRTLQMAVTPGAARTVSTTLAITAPSLPEIYAFGFSTATLLGVGQSDAGSTRNFHADWQLPAAGTPYSLTLFAALFDPAQPLGLGGSMYVWGTAAQPSGDFSMVDGFRVIASGKVADGAATNAGLIINCETANVPNYSGTGVNLVYAKNIDAGHINMVKPIYYLHMVAGQPVPTQAIGALDLGGGEFWLIMHEVATPATVFAVKCGFARPDAAGGITGACDETAPGSGIFVEHALSELAAAR